MKKIFMLSALAASLLVITGCTSYHKDSSADYLECMDPVNSLQYYTEFEVSSQRISSEGKASVVLGLFPMAESKTCLPMRNSQVGLFAGLTSIFSPPSKRFRMQKMLPFTMHVSNTMLTSWWG